VGLAGGNKLEHTVIPFLLRGVSLLGVDSVLCPQAKRIRAWERLTADLPMEHLEAITQTATLTDVPRLAGEILKGKLRGRTVIDVNS
jgi:acrylyl-CoA reductase (NADPH)